MPHASRTPALAVRDLRKSYRDVAVVDGVSFEVLPGECFALLGPNGAGKTTTMEICEGLTAADSGEVQALGLSWERAGELRERIGVQLQETRLSERQTVAETLRLFRSFYRQGFSLEMLIAMARLEPKRDARVGTLSGGQRQRLTLACALAGDPELLFLDEPTAGLDPQSRQQLWALIRALKRTGRTIVLTTHYMEEAEALCDRVAFLDRGRIVATGTPRDLVARLEGEHIVEAEVEPPDFDAAPLEALAVVRSLKREGARVILQTADLQDALPVILVAFYRQSVRLKRLHTRSASLEDAFMALTGRGLSDG